MVNLDEIEVKNYDGKTFLKEDGTYKVKIVDMDQGITPKNATPYVKFECKTEDDRYISMSLYLTDKAMPRFKRFIMALGHPGTGTVDPLEIARKCVNKELVVDCAHRETIDPVTGEKQVGKYLEVVNFKAC